MLWDSLSTSDYHDVYVLLNVCILHSVQSESGVNSVITDMSHSAVVRVRMQMPPDIATLLIP